ncbi:PorT family protein [bacterium SCSIO 12741]|nr:PorT family protein [bacterium SCSIO 12741]
MDKPGNIDDLFRKGLEDVNPEFSANSWEQMESMLDQRTKVNWYRRAGMAVAALLLLSGGWFFLGSDEEAPAVIGADQIAEKASNAATDQTSSAVSTASLFPETESESPLPSATSSAESTLSVVPNETISADQESPVSAVSEEALPQDQPEAQELAAMASSSAELHSLMPKGFAVNSSTWDLDGASMETSGDPIDRNSIRNKRSEIGLRAGLLLNEGLQQRTGIFGGKILQNAGIYYAYHLNSRWAIETGLNYKALSGKGSTLTFTEVDYGFGKTVKTTQIKARSMHYLELPLDVRFSPAAKHTLFAGASVSYLLSVKSDVTSTEEEILAGSSTETQTHWGYQNGFNSLDIAIRAGYDYEVDNRFKVGVLGSYGLKDVTQDQFFEAGDNRNLELRLRLSYRLSNF